MSTPGTMFGRWPLPSRPRLSLWASPIGKPLWKLKTAAAVQLAASQLASPLVLAGDGSCQIGAMMMRCGTSRMPVWYSASGLKHAALLVVVQAGVRRDVVVVVERRADAVVREEVRLADLVVLQHAVGVADAAAEPALARPLGPLGDERVVAVHALGDLPILDVQELRKRPQRLRAAPRRLRRQRAGVGVAEVGVRNLRAQLRRRQREELRIDLVDVDDGVDGAAEREVIAARADVADA